VIGRELDVQGGFLIRLSKGPQINAKNADKTLNQKLGVAFGKVQAVGDRYLLAFFVNFHHALVDWLHIPRFIKFIEEEAQMLVGSFG